MCLPKTKRCVIAAHTELSELSPIFRVAECMTRRPAFTHNPTDKPCFMREVHTYLYVVQIPIEYIPYSTQYMTTTRQGWFEALDLRVYTGPI